MTNVNERHDKSLERSLQARAGQNAALRGALLAFAKPPLTPQHSHSTASKSTASNAVASPARKPKSVAGRQSLPAGPSSHNLTNHDRAQHSPLDTPSQSYDGGKSTLFNYKDMRPVVNGFLAPGLHESSQSKSPSSIAAGLAALRHSPHSTERPLSVLRTDGRQWASTTEEESKPRLSPQHTAGQVRKWLDHMDGTPMMLDANSQEPLQRATTGPSTYSTTHQTTAINQSISSSRMADQPIDYFTPMMYESEGLNVNVRSPRPLRVTSTAASFESAALVSSSELSTSAANSELGRENRLTPTEYTQEFENISRSQADEMSSEFSESEVTGTADEDEQNDITMDSERGVVDTQTIYNASDFRSNSSSMATKPIPIPILNPRPPPSLRSAMDARRKLDNAKKGIQPATPGWKPSSAHHAESLASAMIASSLAASRAPSPAKSPAPPLIRRHTDHPHLQISHLRIGRRPTRSPSPPRTMPHTLRKTKSSSEEEEKDKGRIRRVKRGLHINKHPHKHHEGDRKRWRDEITPRECKRYEGLWAANRGLLIEVEPGTTIDPLNSHVSNLIVRDIWTRSRLPLQALEEVWDLVDREGLGKLTKEEFVVGMWLVDQRLKGRKLPAKVGQSVWRSARGLYGLKGLKRKD